MRDAQGNVIAVYEIKKKNNVDSLFSKEFYIYGSQRLGYLQDKMFLNRKTYGRTFGGSAGIPLIPISPRPGNVINIFLLPGSTTITPIYFGNKRYELSDWLGNVRVVINDKKTPVNSGTTTVSYFPQVTSVSDYYSFGSQIAERSYDPVKPLYRFGFNTQEKVNEISPDHYTAKYWEYDARIGRRWNVDPKPDANWSMYSTFFDNPIKNIDWLGDKPLDDYKIYASGKIEKIKTNDKFDRFYYYDETGKEKFIGQFDKINNNYKGQSISMIEMPKEMESYKFVGNDAKRYLRSEAAAAFFGTVLKFYSETSRRIFVTQFSNQVGGHSDHSKGGPGDFIDILYVNKNKNVIQTVTTDSPNFDREMSQKLVNLFILFGYNSTKEKPKGTGYPSILTQGGGKNGTVPALENTSYFTGHYHHIHLQNYDSKKVENVQK